MNTNPKLNNTGYFKENEEFPLQYVKKAPSELSTARDRLSARNLRAEATWPKPIVQTDLEEELKLSSKNDQFDKYRDENDDRELEELYRRNLMTWKELTIEANVDEELAALENIISQRKAEKLCADLCGFRTEPQHDCGNLECVPGVSKMGCCQQGRLPCWTGLEMSTSMPPGRRGRV